MKYIEEVVGRYKYSPAIYAWEIGNELNLAVDIKNTEFIGTDGTKKMFTSEMLTAYYKLIGDAIRKEDPYRMITGRRRGSEALFNGSLALRRKRMAAEQQL